MMKRVTEQQQQLYLAQAIVREGMKSVAAGMNPMDLKRGIDKAVIAAVEALKDFITRMYRQQSD